MPSTSATSNNGSARTGPQSALPGGDGVASGMGNMPGFGLCRPGDLKLWREMGQHPTIALGDAIVRSPIARCQWSWQKKDDCPDDRRKAIEEMFSPIWSHLLRDALDAIGMGCSPFEIVYGRRGKQGNAVVEMKSLGLAGDPWSTASTKILTDPSGKFIGLENIAGERKVGLPQTNAWLYTHNGLKGNLKGHSRYENLRRDYCRAEELTEEQAKYLKKVSAIIFQLHYPDGTSKDAAGADRPNHFLAEDVLRKVMSGNSVALQNKFAGFLAGDNGMVTPAVLEKALAAAGKSDWMFSFLAPPGTDFAQGYLDTLAYYDKRFFRGLLRPERAGLEATKGGIGQSDAGDHGDVGLNDGEQIAWDLAQSINQGIVDKVLVANWGEGAEGSVWCEPGPLLDTNSGKLAAVLTAGLGNAQIGPELWSLIDRRALLEDVEVPILAAVTKNGVVAIPPAVAAAAAKPELPIKVDGPPATPASAPGNAAVKRLSQAAVRQAGRELERHLSQEESRNGAMLNLSKAGRAKAELTGGTWKTINGAHVYVEDGTGKILAGGGGAQHLIGKHYSAAEAHGKAPAKKEGFHAIARNAKGDYEGTKIASGAIEHVPDHAARMRGHKLPPAWTSVHLSEDHNAKLQATGVDEKGRTQYRYSSEHSEGADKVKQARAAALAKALPDIRREIAEHPSDEAAVLRLIDHTGLRIGSDADTKAEKQAYGATTLRAEHVVSEGDKTRLKFVGKDGVDNDHEITDPKLAAELRERARSGGKLYNTSDAKVRDYLHSVAGDFKVKDLRTVVANGTAVIAVKSIPTPTDAKGYAAARLEVAKAVSHKLGNTPSVALASYINPDVFAPWRSKLANKEQAGLIEQYASKKGITPDAAAKEWITAHGKAFRNDFNERYSGKGKPRGPDPARYGVSGTGGDDELRRSGGSAGGVHGAGGAGAGPRRAARERVAESGPTLAMSQADEGGGHWITIGAEPGEDGKNHGGSPVYIKGGVITKGNDKFVGKKLGDVGSEHHREFHKALVHVAERAKESHGRGVDAHRAAHQAVSNVAPEHLHKELREHAHHLADSLDREPHVHHEEHAVHARVGRQEERRTEASHEPSHRQPR